MASILIGNRLLAIVVAVLAVAASTALAQSQFNGNEVSCRNAHYVWCPIKNTCQSFECTYRSSDLNNQADCTAAGYQWCGNTCIDNGMSCDAVKGIAISILVAIFVLPILCCVGACLAVYFCYVKPQRQQRELLLVQQQPQQQYHYQQQPPQKEQYVQPGLPSYPPEKSYV